jgi:hypothetical protein
VIQVFTESFIRDVVLPEIESTGGATVLASPYGMPPALLRMDKYQPPTWIVATGSIPLDCAVDEASPELVTNLANLVTAMNRQDAYSAVGFWSYDGRLYIEPVETYTSHTMAVQAATDNDQIAIYAMHSGQTEFLAPARGAGALVPNADR